MAAKRKQRETNSFVSVSFTYTCEGYRRMRKGDGSTMELARVGCLMFVQLYDFVNLPPRNAKGFGVMNTMSAEIRTLTFLILVQSFAPVNTPKQHDSNHSKEFEIK